MNPSYHRHETTAHFSSMGRNSFFGDGICLLYRLRKSLFSHDISEYQKSLIIKRLAIDLSVLKQLIWDNRDDCGEEVDGSKGDYLRWIDTSAMLADCSTKTISAGIIDIRPIGESRHEKPETDSGGHRRKSRNHCKIPTIDRFIALVLNIGIARLWHDISEIDIVLVELLGMSET